MTSFLDESAPVRPGEELPIDRLETYLVSHLPGSVGPLSIEQFPHGYSNLTYLLRLGVAEWVLRRPPFGNQVKTAHDMAREYRVLRAIAPHYPPAPQPVLECTDETVIGAPFYVMERRRGIIPRKRLPPGLTLDAPTARDLGHALIDNLVRLHALDYSSAGLGDLGKPDGYVSRQVHGWVKRYNDARTDDVPTLESVAAWMLANLPAEVGPALIHNDYKFDNLLLDPNNLRRIVGVLDWEMATIGDPLMDLGTTLGYWVEAGDPPALKQVATGPTDLPGSLTRRELVERYAEQSGRTVSQPLFYYCYGLYKIAGIVQQIYARYKRGLTRDQRFGRLHEFVAALARQAEFALDAGKI